MAFVDLFSDSAATVEVTSNEEELWIVDGETK
jgi:hypothetical protein